MQAVRLRRSRKSVKARLRGFIRASYPTTRKVAGDSGKSLESVTRYYIDHAGEGCFVRVAVIADVHGNLEALRAVLAHIEQGGVDEIVVAGDTVNISPHSKACWDLVRSLGCPILRGNHELYIYSYGTPEADPTWAEERFKGLAWVQSQFSADDLRAMRRLPLPHALPDLLVPHASPRSVFDSVSEDTPVEKLREMFT